MTQVTVPVHDRRSAGSPSLASTSRTVMLWTLVSRATGFARVTVLGAVIGPTFFGNLFQTLTLLPGTMFALLGGSLVGAVLVPRLVGAVDRGDRGEVGRLAGGFLGTVLAVLALVAGLLLLCGPALLSLVTAAVPDPAVRAKQGQVGGLLLAMLLPQIFFAAVAATGAAVQHAQGRFALAAAAPAAENSAAIAVLILSALVFGGGPELGDVSTAQLLLLGVGTTAAAALQGAVQWWGAWRSGVALLPRAGWRDAEVRRILRAGLTASRHTGLYNLTWLGLVLAAGGIPGAVIALQIGQSFATLPVALGATPVAAAQLPRLARLASTGVEFHAIFRDGVALARFSTLPAGLLLTALCVPLAHAVALGQMAGTSAIALTAACIGGLGVGVAGEALIVVAASAAYARRDGTAPFHAMLLRALIAAGGMAGALVAFEGAERLWALALSVSAASLASAAFLHWRVVRRLPALPAPIGGVTADLGIAALSVAVAALVAAWLAPPAGSALGWMSGLAAALGASGAVYVGLQWLRGSREVLVFLPAGPRRSPLRSGS
ncbi:MAG TPA: lipid II flippase MurJ [Azospirillaceae bacterium]|nr:lipid II flippase MurJ [Azospirillaceae bacterium]